MDPYLHNTYSLRSPDQQSSSNKTSSKAYDLFTQPFWTPKLFNEYIVDLSGNTYFPYPIYPFTSNLEWIAFLHFRARLEGITMLRPISRDSLYHSFIEKIKHDHHDYVVIKARRYHLITNNETFNSESFARQTPYFRFMS